MSTPFHWPVLLAALALPWACGAASLIGPADEWSYRLVAGAPPPTGWTAPGFDDSGWARARGGFSLGLTGYTQATTALESPFPGTPGIGLLLRKTFDWPAGGEVRSLFLRIEYEDGLRVWWNGREVLRRGYPPEGEPRWDDVPVPHVSGEAEVFELPVDRLSLGDGPQHLAVQVTDASPWFPTLFAWPELRADFTRGPVLQNLSTQRVLVTWTAPAATNGWVEYWPAAEPAKVQRVAGVAGAEQVIALEGLQPGTTYGYRAGVAIRGGSVAARASSFTTLKPAGDVDFVVIGDTGGGRIGQLRMAEWLGRQEADLVLHTGDLIYPTMTAGRLDLRYFSMYEPLLRRVAVFPTIGNHDLYSGDAAYVQAFHLPTNNATGTEHYYSFDHGDVHFVSLFVPWYGMGAWGLAPPDGRPGDPVRWLEQDLALTRKPWKVVFFHQAPRTSGPHLVDDYNVDGRRDIAQTLSVLLPVLEAGGVRVVLTGHDHDWERFAPTNGVSFVVTGGGGAELYAAYQREVGSTRFLTAFHGLRLAVRGRELRGAVEGPEGTLLDQFLVALPPGEALSMEAAWHTPDGAAAGPDSGDGNRVGQRWDLRGEGIAATTGRSANLGRLVVNQDAGAIYLGWRDVQLWPGQLMAVFLESPRRTGVHELPAGRPWSTWSVAFEDFRPAWVALLGDEFGDQRAEAVEGAPAGALPAQGVYEIDGDGWRVAARVEQFNTSPERGTDGAEQSADFIEVRLPRATLGGVLPGDTVRVAAVAVTPRPAGSGVVWEVDDAVLGRWVMREDRRRLEPVNVHLSLPGGADADGDGLDGAAEAQAGSDPGRADTDGDGLPDGWEVRHGLEVNGVGAGTGPEGDLDGDGLTQREEFLSGRDPRVAEAPLRLEARGAGGEVQLGWDAVMGRDYDLEVAEQVSGPFRAGGFAGFPRRATGTREQVVWRPGPDEAQVWLRLRERRRP